MPFGVSDLFDPDEDDDNAAGFLLGVGGGAALAVSPTLSLVGELGYTHRFLSWQDEDVTSRWVHIGVGVQAAL